ncbi:MAG: galactose-1-phosphate uridylyltransferase [Nitrospirae bacterium]|nr:galactose-1-phosphate uridylyltransferase [Nitrospirota bacterium]
MPELRKDPIIGRWVIISSERGKRPSDFTDGGERKRKGGFCPFDIGNEHTTPPNKFPALQIEGDLNKQGEGVFDKMNGVGAHEVIIETPLHDATLSTMALKDVENVLWAYRDRIVDLKKDKRFQYVLIFKNEGEAAGASLEHSHSQLIALPIVPKRVREEIDGAKQYYDYKERCVFCDIIRQELNAGIRVVSENKDFVALEPFTPRFPFETWILPKKHDSCFEDARTHEFPSLAEILQTTLRRIDKVLNVPPYNYILHSSPFREPDNDYYHWHMEIMPKLTKVAGFEWGSGFYINPTAPEEAAKFLREAKI